MKNNIQPSLKAHNSEIKKAILLMTETETKEFELNVVSVLEQALDTEIKKADLLELCAINLIKIGIARSPEFWDLSKNNLKASVIKSRQITEKTFEGYWTAISLYMFENGEVVKPKATSADAVRKAEKRAEIDKMSIAELEKKSMFKEIGARKEKQAKDLKKENDDKIKDKISENLAFAKENLISNLALMAFLKNPSNLEKVIKLANA